MTIKKIPMTPEGLRKLHELYKRLKAVDRPTAITALSVARSHGDLSENAEYDIAKETLSQLEKQISDVEAKLAAAHVIDPATMDHDKVVFGATVTVLDVDSGDEITYQIVGVDEADISAFKISVESPIARALIGKSEGDETTVKSPKGMRILEILRVEYIG
ncbi:MAG: transcription elongation factor GreA [Deltaproteobacteria bacterium CG11_big_fil_rev_8_21_14_0_20_47_16]|nr:MAG: transcription elongation factor GreA [Deltaproteobacteria bacterium CG11_big_fil_rev_8_21_14_0_20_47_16]